MTHSKEEEEVIHELEEIWGGGLHQNPPHLNLFSFFKRTPPPSHVNQPKSASTQF